MAVCSYSPSYFGKTWEAEVRGLLVPFFLSKRKKSKDFSFKLHAHDKKQLKGIN
jgi:hypothetical protein